jgi:hypothetical protein
MVTNSSDFTFLFQKLTCTDPVSVPQEFKLETILQHKIDDSLLKNTIRSFPKADVSLAEETIGSGNFINPFIYTGNESTIYSQGKKLSIIDIESKRDYLVVNDRSEIITA